MTINVYFESPDGEEFYGWVGGLYDIEYVKYPQTNTTLGIRVQVMEPWGFVQMPHNRLGKKMATALGLLKTYPIGSEFMGPPNPEAVGTITTGTYIPLDCIRQPILTILQRKFRRRETIACKFSCDIFGNPTVNDPHEQLGATITRLQIANQLKSETIRKQNALVMSLIEEFGKPRHKHIEDALTTIKKLQSVNQSPFHRGIFGSRYGFGSQYGPPSFDEDEEDSEQLEPPSQGRRFGFLRRGNADG